LLGKEVVVLHRVLLEVGETECKRKIPVRDGVAYREGDTRGSLVDTGKAEHWNNLLNLVRVDGMGLVVRWRMDNG
jgi:hypothetical protein